MIKKNMKTQDKLPMDSPACMEEDFEAIIKALPDGIIIIDPCGVIVYHNEKARDFLHAGTVDLLGQPFGYKTCLDAVTEIEVHRPNQLPHIYETRAVETIWQGQNAFLLTLTDITDSKRSERALRESQEKFSKLFQANPDCVVLSYLEGGKIIDVNEGFVRLFGYQAQEVIHRTSIELRLWSDLTDRDEYVRRLRNTGECMDYETLLVTKDGWVMPVNISARTIELDHQISTLSIIRDISQYKNSAKALQKANDKLSLWIDELETRNKETSLLNEMGDMLQSCLSLDEAYKVVGKYAEMLFKDQSGALYIYHQERKTLQKRVSWGEALQSMDEFEEEDCWGIRRGRPHEMTGSKNLLLCNHIHPQMLENDFVQNICIPLIAQGDSLGLLYLQLQPGQDIDHWKQLGVSIAERAALDFANQRLRDKLHQQSIRDSLTGLFNRRYMEETLHREIRRAMRHEFRLGIVMIDVDHFKKYNDKYGHETGDLVLKEIGNYLQQNLRAEDVVCRFGGEEFIIILPDASLDDTHKRAMQWRETIKSIHVGRYDMALDPVTISIGVAAFPDHGKSVDDLLHIVDQALYSAKNAGRDCVMIAQLAQTPNSQ
jgi:diguanylate cyclase (GGDEF)-like protein/PAS domain S-box-containing protein